MCNCAAKSRACFVRAAHGVVWRIQQVCRAKMVLCPGSDTSRVHVCMLLVTCYALGAQRHVSRSPCLPSRVLARESLSAGTLRRVPCLPRVRFRGFLSSLTGLGPRIAKRTQVCSRNRGGLPLRSCPASGLRTCYFFPSIAFRFRLVFPHGSRPANRARESCAFCVFHARSPT